MKGRAHRCILCALLCQDKGNGKDREMKQFFKEGTPEQTGISSDDIMELINHLDDEGLYMHSLIIIRNGKLVTEGYYKPLKRETKHRLYSSSKSFAGGAIGLLCDEGKIKLTDKVHTFFPEYDAESLHPYIRETTIRDLLMMASPHNGTTYSIYPESPDFHDWVGSFFKKKPTHSPGTLFHYDTSATYILGVIVERITGMPLLSYMQDKILRHLGFSEDTWCMQSTDGYSWLGSGIFCTPLDFAKYAFLFLRGGNIGGKQLLSEEYAKAAVSKQIPNDNFGYGSTVHNSGYGYQIWCMPEDGFMFSGMGGQCAYCFPKLDLVIACTGNNLGCPHHQQIQTDAVLKYIVHRSKDSALEENPAAHQKLKKRLETLNVRVPCGNLNSVWTEKIHNVTYIMDENPLGFKNVRFLFNGDEGVLQYENARGKKEIPFGIGKYKEGTFPEADCFDKKIGTWRDEKYKCIATAVWNGENQLLLRVNILDYCIGNLGISFGFKDDFISLTAKKCAEGFLHNYDGVAGGRRISF